MPNDDFQLVTSKKRNKARNRGVHSTVFLDSSDRTCNLDKKYVLRRLQLSKDELSASNFYLSLLVAFNQGFRDLGSLCVTEILCYGLGHFADAVGPRYQLGLLLLLKEYFNAVVYVYDPVFYQLECELISELGCNLILENEEGKRAITKPTLVYLPHCCKQLTNNFLWSNWGPGLQDCVILGNSFSKIIESIPQRFLNNAANYMLTINHYIQEIVVENNFKYTDIFNDLAIHIFPGTKLNLITQDIWNTREEPEYNSEDTEFISNKLLASLTLDN